jgi:hypothetical protein
MSTQSAFRWSTWIGIDIDDPDLRVTPARPCTQESSTND